MLSHEVVHSSAGHNSPDNIQRVMCLMLHSRGIRQTGGGRWKTSAGSLIEQKDARCIVENTLNKMYCYCVSLHAIIAINVAVRFCCPKTLFPNWKLLLNFRLFIRVQVGCRAFSPYIWQLCHIGCKFYRSRW